MGGGRVGGGKVKGQLSLELWSPQCSGREWGKQ